MRYVGLAGALVFLVLGGCVADMASHNDESVERTQLSLVQEVPTPEEESAAAASDAHEYDRRPPTLLEIASFVHTRRELPADALLPAAVPCNEPVAGRWVSREYFEEHGDWYRFELRMKRDPGQPGKLKGEIVSRSWTGSPSDTAPGKCHSRARENYEFDWTVRMRASGVVEGDQLSFEGTSLSVDENRCGVPVTEGSYNLDRFSGHLLEDGLHLVAFNNDGGRADHELHLFRRVACARGPSHLASSSSAARCCRNATRHPIASGKSNHREDRCHDLDRRGAARRASTPGIGHSAICPWEGSSSTNRG